MCSAQKEAKMKNKAQKNHKIPFKKRISLIVGLVLFYQGFNDQILSRYQENVSLQETEFVKNYIISQRPNIDKGELLRLTETIVLESGNLEMGSEISALTRNKTSFLLAIIQTESQFKKTARSKKNAQGYMQLMKPTAVWLAKMEGLTLDTSKIHEPEVNILLGVTYMNYLGREMGSLEEATLAYNAGPNAVRKWGGVNEYWETVNKNYKQIQSSRPTVSKNFFGRYVAILQ